MGKRSATKSRFPSLLDNVVAGGLPHGYSPLECAIKECWEEASIENSIARSRLKCTGSITRCCEEEGFLALEEIFVFDLDMTGLPPPKPSDGEVESFSLLSCEDIVGNLALKVKPDVLIIVVDFMIRHGMVDSESDPKGFLELIRAMHSPIPTHQSTRSLL
jgi:8-oxo-dGTP pyrophosphatase MutT (NUDIX family)